MYKFYNTNSFSLTVVTIVDISSLAITVNILEMDVKIRKHKLYIGGRIDIQEYKNIKSV